jgi:hypothetical protein
MCHVLSWRALRAPALATGRVSILIASLTWAAEGAKPPASSSVPSGAADGSEKPTLSKVLPASIRLRKSSGLPGESKRPVMPAKYRTRAHVPSFDEGNFSMRPAGPAIS